MTYESTIPEQLEDEQGTPFGNDLKRWNAVQRRDPRAEGIFFYAVQTTGIYCYPTCAARLPKRENVMYFVRPEDAEAAGFRPCKRCTPGAAPPSAARSALLVRACRLIGEAENPPTLGELAAAVGLSPGHLHRVFRAGVGVTPKRYAAALRDRRMQQNLADGAPVTAALYDAGFGASSRFYEGADKRLGMSATDYRKGAAGLTLRYAHAETSLGWLIVAATERGVCAAEFGETPAALLEGLQRRFSGAVLRPDATLNGWLEQIVGAVETPSNALNLPLDIQGTAFQQQVWRALQTIPSGQTRSYTEVAELIGRPAAVRAVARACASNEVAVAVPCHRVVRSDGELSGYRWGVERKRELLSREAQAERRADDT